MCARNAIFHLMYYKCNLMQQITVSVFCLVHVLGPHILNIKPIRKQALLYLNLNSFKRWRCCPCQCVPVQCKACQIKFRAMNIQEVFCHNIICFLASYLSFFLLWGFKSCCYTLPFTIDMMAFIQAQILYHIDSLNLQNICDVSSKT